MAPRLLAPLRLSGLLALAALLIGAQELLGLLLPLVDLAVELPAGLVPGDLSGLLDAFVRHVGMLPSQFYARPVAHKSCGQPSYRKPQAGGTRGAASQPGCALAATCRCVRWPGRLRGGTRRRYASNEASRPRPRA